MAKKFSHEQAASLNNSVIHICQVPKVEPLSIANALSAI